MRRRLTIAIIGTVLAALVVTGLGTMAIAAARARHQSESALREQAEATASILDISATAGTEEGRLARLQRFTRVRNALDLDDLSLVVIRPDDELGVELSDPLPRRLTVERLDPDALRRGETTSGSVGNQVWAAAALNPGAGSVGVVVLTRPVDRALGPVVGWFVLASVIAIVLAAVVAHRLAGQLTRPLREATGATARIAAGDLAVRLPVADGRSDEVAELSTSINQMTANLERSRHLEQHFLMSVSHDLRTPLTSIRGYAEAVADGTAPDARAAAAIILAESRRLERLVRDLLDLARLDARQFTLDIATIDVGDLVRRAVDGFAQAATETGITIDVDAPTTPALLATDADRLGQVLANLLENALKYATSAIHVDVVVGDDRVEIGITDDGPGIDPDDLAHVFERLYVARRPPVRATGGNAAGSGLGLAIAHELVTAMGGHVTATAAPSGGTRLTVVLSRGESVR